MNLPSKILGSLSAAVLAAVFLFPGQAVAGNYIIKPSGQGGNDYHLKLQVQQGNYGGNYNQNTNVSGYVPMQFIIVVPNDQPTIRYELRGGGVFSSDADDRGSVSFREEPFDYGLTSAVRYELYSIQNFNGRAGTLINTLTSEDPRFRNAIDYSGGRQGENGCFRESDNAKEAPCWVASNTFSTASHGPFNDARFPQYSGYRVYLLKVVVRTDENKGFVNNVAVTNVAGFMNPTTPSDPIYPNNPGFDGTGYPGGEASNGFFVRTIGSDKAYLTTAPVNTAMALQWGSQAAPDKDGNRIKDETRVNEDYEKFHGNDYARDYMKILFRGRNKRNFSGPGGTPSHNPGDQKIGNVDWDSAPNGGSDGFNPGTDGWPEATINHVPGSTRSFISQTPGGVNRTSGNFWSSTEAPCTGNECYWDSRDAWHFKWPPSGVIGDGVQATLGIHHVNGSNTLLFGGPAFGDGELPAQPPVNTTCPNNGAPTATEGLSTVTILTPRLASCGYAYNGNGANRSLNLSAQYSGSRFTKSWRRIDFGSAGTTGYAEANPAIHTDTGNFPEGAHTYEACSAASRWNTRRSDMKELHRYRDPGHADDRYFYGSDGAGPPGWVDGGAHGWIFRFQWDPSLVALNNYYDVVDHGGSQEVRWYLGTSNPGGSWQFGGLQGYVFTTDVAGGNRIPLYQHVRNAAGHNHFAYDNDNDFNTGGGYVNDGVRFYVAGSNNVPTDAPNTANLYGDASDLWACTITSFWVNVAPSAVQLSPATGTQFNYVCSATSPMSVRVTNNNNAAGYFPTYVGGDFVATINGTEYTSDPINKLATAGGSVDISSDEVNRQGTTTQFTTWIQEFVKDIPGGGVTVFWRFRPYNYAGTSDMNLLDRLRGFPVFEDDTIRQTQVTYKRGAETPNQSFYVRTPPRLSTAGSTTKQYFNHLTGQEYPAGNGFIDGQTVRVRLTVRNTGQTPAASYSVKDNFGSTRDFEVPFNFTVNGSAVTPAVDSSGSEHVIDFGTSGGAALPVGELASGASFTIEYLTRANRNQGSDIPPDPARTSTMSASRAEFSVQENYCAGGMTTQPVLSFTLKDTFAPYIRAGRGNVGTNQRVNTYAGQGVNATYIVQANGTITGFTGGTELRGYAAGNQGLCAPPGAVDWRREMTSNIRTLRTGSRTTATNGFSSNLFSTDNTVRGRLNPAGQPNVWVHSGTLNITQPTAFTGVGTIVVYGDLNISADLTYSGSDSTQIHSLGVIVLGNLNIAPNVQTAVGSYYVSDIRTDANGLPILGANGCPTLVGTSGYVNTASGNAAKDLPLDVQGLMVAKSFNFARYYDAGQNTASVQPAENFYYDGRIIAATPPGFGSFRDSTGWVEVAP